MNNSEEVHAIAKEIKRISCSHMTNTKVFLLLTEEEEYLKTTGISVFADTIICKKDNWFDELVRAHTKEEVMVEIVETLILNIPALKV